MIIQSDWLKQETHVVVFFFFVGVSESFESNFLLGASSGSLGFDATASVSGFFAAGSPPDERLGLPRLPGVGGVGLTVGAAGVDVNG